MKTIARMSLKLKRVRVDSGYNNASLMIKVVPIGSIIVARPEPTICEPQPAIVIILPGDFLIDSKYLVSRKMVCVVALSARHVSSIRVPHAF